MPHGNPRTQIAIRLSPDALAQVDVLAEQEERTRTDMLRKLLSEALAARSAAAAKRQR